MGDFGNAIKYLYEKFILRDVLSFITPGAIVFLAAFSLFLPGSSFVQRLDMLLDYSTSMSWLLYIPLFGIFYLVGYALQCFGVIVGLIERHRDPKMDEVQVNFLNITANAEWARHHYERVVVHKQMCGSGIVTIIIVAILLAFDYCPWSYANLFIVSVVALLLLISLILDYRDTMVTIDNIKKAINRLYKSGTLKEDR